jgi:HAD superfamily hydrolase (TIGR01544 family)
MKSLIEKYEEDQILISNPEGLKAKINAIKADGASHLDIVSDFDFTLSRKSQSGTGPDSAFGVLARSSYMSEQLRAEYKSLYDHYYPIEKDEHITFAEKNVAMCEWWDKSLMLISDKKFTDAEVVNSIRESAFAFRHGFDYLAKAIADNKIVLYVLSAGISKVITYAIFEALHTKTLNNIRVISNDWREKDGKQEFIKPHIYTTNKNEYLCVGKHPSLRKNAILMGDMLEDLMMVKHSGHKCVITIGYYNKVSQQIPIESYTKSFDIVIAGQGSLIHATKLIYALFNSKLFDDVYTKYPSSKVLSELLKK